MFANFSKRKWANEEVAFSRGARDRLNLGSAFENGREAPNTANRIGAESSAAPGKNAPDSAGLCTNESKREVPSFH